jgi:hypothetical protein
MSYFTSNPVKNRKKGLTTLLTTLSLTSLITGCANVDANLVSEAQAQAPPSNTPTTPATAVLPTATPSPTSSPTTGPLPTPTPWPTPQSWSPQIQALPTLAPIPVAPVNWAIPNGSIPVSYSPPDGVDVFGSTILRWSYYGELAPDEFFDIKIKPVGSNDSVFVEWSKTPEFNLRAWSGWQPGLYTWQIGIVQGYRDGNEKHFIADTGRDSEPSLIKWQSAGGGGGGNSGIGGSSGGGSTDGGGSSGGGGGSSSGGS